MEHLEIPSSTLPISVDPNIVPQIDPSSLRSDERIGEILQDPRENKLLSLSTEGASTNYRPEDFLMLDCSNTQLPSTNPLLSSFQSCCTMCSSCRRVLVFPANSLESIQCPACKRTMDIDPQLLESKLLRNCPQCDTLLGNPTNAPRVLCPLCMRLIEWSSAILPGKEGIIPEAFTEEISKKKRARKSKEMSDFILEASPPNSETLASPTGDNEGVPVKKKKGYVKKGEPGYVRPKYSYIKKGQPGYVRPKYSYIKKGQPGYRAPKSSLKRKNEDGGMSSSGESTPNPNVGESFVLPKLEDATAVAEAAALLNHALETAAVDALEVDGGSREPNLEARLVTQTIQRLMHNGDALQHQLATNV